MSRFPLLAFAIINLLCSTKQAQSQQDYLGQEQAASGQPSEQSKEQTLQLLLAKLVPILWAANERRSSTSLEQHMGQSGGQQTGPTGYVTGETPAGAATANNNNNNNGAHLSHWQHKPLAPYDSDQAAAAAFEPAPARQLISQHSNSLFYPPGELHAAQSAQLVPLPAHHSGPGAPLQWLGAPSVAVASKPADEQWRRPTRFAHLLHASEQANLVSPAASLGQRPSAPLTQLSPLIQAVSPSSTLAFLASNKASLSNLIQLLPLIAQTVSILPKVLSPLASGGAGVGAPQASGPHEQLERRPGQPVQSLIQSAPTTSGSAEPAESANSSAAAAQPSRSGQLQQQQQQQVDQQRPGWFWPGSLLQDILAPLARQLLAAPQATYELASSQHQQIPSYSTADPQPTGALASWIQGLIGHFGSPARSWGQQQQQQAAADLEPVATGSGQWISRWPLAGWLRQTLGSLAESSRPRLSGAAKASFSNRRPNELGAPV